MAFGNYKQYDSRWGSKNYNGSSNYSQAACGPTSCANILCAVDSSITPLTTGKYMQKHGFAIRNNGTAWAGIPACLKAFGATNVQAVSSMAKVWELMNEGYVGVFLFRGGSRGGVTWTTSGHYIAVTDYKVKDGKHYLYTRDSGGRGHTGWYAYETTMKGLIPQIWLCKVRKEVLNPITKPTGKYDGTLPSTTIKEGSEGAEVKKWQSFLNWYGDFKLTVDGQFGNASHKATRVFQVTEGLEDDGAVGAKTRAKAKAYIPSEGVTTEGVVEESPSSGLDEKPASVSNAKLIGDMALELSWATNTPKSQWNYSYSKTKKWTKWSQLGKAKPKKKCMEAMDKYMKDHWTKGSAKYGYGGRVCASCDKFVGLVIRATGVNRSMPSTLEEFFKGKGFGKFEKVKTGGKKSKMKHGDIIVYKRKSGGGHTLIVAEHNGTKLGCQAGLNHYFPRRKKLTNYDLSDYKKFDVWRAK